MDIVKKRGVNKVSIPSHAYWWKRLNYRPQHKVHQEEEANSSLDNDRNKKTSGFRVHLPSSTRDRAKKWEWKPKIPWHGGFIPRISPDFQRTADRPLPQAHYGGELFKLLLHSPLLPLEKKKFLLVYCRFALHSLPLGRMFHETKNETSPDSWKWEIHALRLFLEDLRSNYNPLGRLWCSRRLVASIALPHKAVEMTDIEHSSRSVSLSKHGKNLDWRKISETDSERPNG